jgi:hypothetical protein
MNTIPANLLQDPHVSLGFAQGVVRMALSANGIVVKATDDKLEFYVEGVKVADYQTTTDTLAWREGCNKNQDKLIKAHCCLYRDPLEV